MAAARVQVSMILAILLGLAYLVWLTWAEGWRLWVVLGVMLLVAGLGGAVHMAMGMARARDGLDSESEPEAATQERTKVDAEGRS